MSSSNSATQILGSQYEVFYKFSFPPLHVFCVSSCIKAVDRKKQHCPISASMFRPWHTRYQTCSQQFSAESQNLLTHIEGKTRQKSSFLKLWFLNQLPEKFHSHLHGRFTATLTPDLHPWVHCEVLEAAALMICDMLCIQEPKVLALVCSKRDSGVWDLLSSLGTFGLIPLLAWEQRGKRSRTEKWTGRNTKNSQINPPERPNLLNLSNMNRQEIWGPWEDALVRVTRSLWASPFSRHPAAGAAQLSRNFQDKQIQGCPPLNSGSLTAHCQPLLHRTHYCKLYYTLL